jgi:hypothetical protein
MQLHQCLWGVRCGCSVTMTYQERKRNSVHSLVVPVMPDEYYVRKTWQKLKYTRSNCGPAQMEKFCRHTRSQGHRGRSGQSSWRDFWSWRTLRAAAETGQLFGRWRRASQPKLCRVLLGAVNEALLAQLVPRAAHRRDRGATARHLYVSYG